MYYLIYYYTIEYIRFIDDLRILFLYAVSHISFCPIDVRDYIGVANINMSLFPVLYYVLDICIVKYAVFFTCSKGDYM